MAQNFQQGDDPPPINGGSSADGRRRSIANGKRPVVTQANALSPAPPCGACKFLRRKCSTDCNFAPYFRSEQGAALFAAVHKVFGASNVSKHLNNIDPIHRRDTIFSICYEAQARLANPVHGCVATIMSLQQQVATLQVELSMVQGQLMNSRLALMNALQNMQNQQNPNLLHQNFGVLQPALSNNSSASNNMFNFSNLPSTTNVPVEAAPSSGFDPLQYSQLTPEEEAAQEENDDPAAFADQILGKN